MQEVRSQARRRLMSCKVLSEAYNPDHLPGGTWREGPTRDVSYSYWVFFVFQWLLIMAYNNIDLYEAATHVK